MITFNVVKETHGWAVRLGEQMSTPFWSRDMAVREANRLAEAIGCHGECTEVIVEGVRLSALPRKGPPMRSAPAGGVGTWPLDASVAYDRRANR